jgi:hypothetical protein
VTTQAAIQKEIEEIKQRFIPPKDIWVIFSFGPDKASHGKYGHRKLNIFTGETEPVDESEELELMRSYYENLPDHCKNKRGPWPTFEKFLEYHECKCGKAHPYHNPEYRQQNKWDPHEKVENHESSPKF